jgi:hypothetical protein
VRGFDADIIFIDEVFFMNANTLFTVIFPVLQQTNTCLICTTTPGKPDHALAKVINTVDDEGDYIFNTVRIGKPCEACDKARIMCTHVTNAQPEGTSRSKRERYMKFYENGLEAVAMQEFQGVMMNKNSRIFEQAWIDALRQRKRKKLKDNVQFLMMTIDPAHGGDNEWATIVSYFDPGSGKMVIVFMDSSQTEANYASIKLRMEVMLETVRGICPRFRTIPIVIACESAPKLFAGVMAETLKDISASISSNICVMAETTDRQPGVPINDGNKRTMALMSARLMQYNAVSFSEKFTTIDLVISENDMINKFLNTLPFMMRKVEMRPDGTVKTRITGKGSGCPNDDISQAFMMQPYWVDAFLTSNRPEYELFKAMFPEGAKFSFKVPKDLDVPFFTNVPNMKLRPARKRKPIQAGAF